MAKVEAREIRKHFGQVHAVNGINLASEEGEFLVLLGPSGCGKTTLLRMIAGLEQPSSGEILIDGRVVNDLPPRARRIAMVFQSYALYPHKTVYGNIAFPLRAARMNKSLIHQNVERAAAMFGIEALLERRPRELSGGERQRVALARALVREPSVFLLDEPLSNLDAKLRASARDELKLFQKEIGTTTIYVTHDQVEAMGLGDRIAVINQGQVRQLGTPQEVYHRPADTFVASFVGSPPMNLIEHGEFILGFRPERFLPQGVHMNGAGEGNLVPFHFRVRRVEQLGSDRLLYGALDEGGGVSTISRLPFNVTIPIAEGQTYPFAVHAQDLNYFDQETGQRISPKPLASPPAR